MRFVVGRVAPTRRERAQDAALAVTLTAAGLVEIWAPLASALGEGSPTASSVFVVLLGVAVAFRRTGPVAVLGAVVGVSLLAYAFAPVHVLFWGGMLPVMVAVYTVARHESARVAWPATGVTAALLLLLDLAVVDQLDPNDFAFLWANAFAAFMLGLVLRRTEDAAQASALRAAAAEEDAERAAASARAEERTRIAREMHDVVAHSVSVMVVQAGAAEAAMEEDPGYTRDALGRIRETGVEALEDMHRVLTVLRDPEVHEVLPPQPGLADLPELLRGSEAGGVGTELVVEGQPRPLPAGLDLTAYRILQEALTNVRRHAAADRVTVILRFEETQVEVEIVDDGGGRPAMVPGPAGHGILGMRERVALYDGRLEAHAGECGFRVRAVLPLGAG